MENVDVYEKVEAGKLVAKWEDQQLVVASEVIGFNPTVDPLDEKFMWEILNELGFRELHKEVTILEN